MIMQISADMMATMMTSVDYKGKSGYELSQFVNDNIIPELQRQDGVASVDTSGMVEKSIEVRLNQDKIDEVNEKVLEKTNKSLVKAKKKLDNAEKKLNEGKEKLSEQKKKLTDQQNEKSGELAKFSKLMNQAVATKQAYASNLTSQKAKKSALEMEKKAYEKNKIAASYRQMNQGFTAVRESMQQGNAGYQAIYDAIYDQILVAAVQKQMDAAGIEGKVTTENVHTYLEKLSDAAEAIKNAAKEEAAAQTEKQVKQQLAQLPKNVKDAIRIN